MRKNCLKTFLVATVFINIATAVNAGTIVPISFQGSGRSGSSLGVTWSYGMSHWEKETVGSEKPLIRPLGSTYPIGEIPAGGQEVEKKNMFGPKDLGANGTDDNIMTNDKYEHGTKSEHNFSLTTIQRDNVLIDGEVYANEVTDWIGFALVKLIKACEKNYETCEPVDAFTEISIAGVSKRAEIKKLPEPKPQQVKESLPSIPGTNSTQKVTYTLAPNAGLNSSSGLEVNVLEAIFYVQNMMSGSVPAVSLALGPKENPGDPSSWPYQLEFEFNHLTCVLNASQPSCPYFMSYLSGYLSDINKWSFDPIAKSWSAKDYLAMPSLTVIGLLGNNYPEDTLTTSSTTKNNDVETPVPSPLALLGLGPAFRCKRRLLELSLKMHSK